MTNEEQGKLAEINIRLTNVEKGIERVITNDLPHLTKAVGYLKGKMSVLQPLTIGVAVGIVLLIIGLVLNILGVY